MAFLDEYVVGVDGPWSDSQAAHLWRRAGFGALPSERQSAVATGDQQAFRASVDSLVNFLPDDPYLDQPAGSAPGVLGDPLADLPDDTSDLGNLKRADSIRNLQAQWLYRMRYTSQPLQEQLTLFLHDHFVSEAAKVSTGISNAVNLGNDGSTAGQSCTGGSLAPDASRQQKMLTALMRDQNYLYRRSGADDFRQSLIDVTRNPAMLIYLDNARNRRGTAQENYAREMMELFSMGVGNYSENDIRQIAKCLTGETIPQNQCKYDWSLAYGFAPVLHEPGVKTVFGHTIAQSTGGQETIDVIDLVLAKISVNPDVSALVSPYDTLPAAAIYISWKLLCWFVSNDIPLLPTPHPAVLELADYFRGSDNGVYPARRYPFDIRAALRRIFLSKFFFDAANFYTQVKTPADYVIMALRMLQIGETFTSNQGPAVRMGGMGMTLFAPPNVAGWNQGTAWITSGNLVQRFNYANRIAEVVLGGTSGNTYIDALLQSNGGPLASATDHAGMIEYFRARLIQEPLQTAELTLLQNFLDSVTGTGSALYRAKIRGLIHVMLTMPRFQLK